MIPVLAFVQHYKKFYTSQFESAAVRHGLNQLEIDILLFLHNNPDCRTASDICRYRGLANPMYRRRWSGCAHAAC